MKKINLGLFADILTLIGFIIALLGDLPRGLKIVFIILVFIWGIHKVVCYFKDNPVKDRDKTIQTGKNVILNTKHLIILFGGDLSWTDDYLKELKILIQNSKTVEVTFPISKLTNHNKAMKERLKKLSDNGINLYYTDNDIGLRCMISDPFLDNKNDYILYIANRLKTDKSENNKYLAQKYNFANDEAICNSFYKFYILSKSIRYEYHI